MRNPYQSFTNLEDGPGLSQMIILTAKFWFLVVNVEGRCIMTWFISGLAKLYHYPCPVNLFSVFSSMPVQKQWKYPIFFFCNRKTVHLGLQILPKIKIKKFRLKDCLWITSLTGIWSPCPCYMPNRRVGQNSISLVTVEILNTAVGGEWEELKN